MLLQKFQYDGAVQDNVFNQTTKQNSSELELQVQKLKKTIEERDKFFSIVSHDLKSPFASFLGFIRMMVEDIESFTKEELQIVLEDMLDSVENQYKLLENILQWSMLQRQSNTFELQPHSLSQILDHSIQMIRIMAEQKNISVDNDTSSELLVFTDHNLLSTVVRNLLMNSIKFTPEYGLIHLYADYSEGNTKIAIRDNGIGMDGLTLKNIFAMNKRSRGVGTNGEKGTGIGLIMCKDFVQKLGGKIWAESEPRKGAAFYIVLPGKRESVQS